MELRDVLAALAMMAGIQAGAVGETLGELARTSYVLADLMLKERDKGEA